MDGWYRSFQDAAEMRAYWEGVFPQERFTYVMPSDIATTVIADSMRLIDPMRSKP